MVPVFEDIIVEQLQRHVDRLAAFEGIAIDRLDYSELFSFDNDDGVSWVPHNRLDSWFLTRGVGTEDAHHTHPCTKTNIRALALTRARKQTFSPSH